MFRSDSSRGAAASCTRMLTLREELATLSKATEAVLLRCSGLSRMHYSCGVPADLDSWSTHTLTPSAHTHTHSECMHCRTCMCTHTHSGILWDFCVTDTLWFNPLPSASQAQLYNCASLALVFCSHMLYIYSHLLFSACLSREDQILLIQRNKNNTWWLFVSWNAFLFKILD